MEHIVREILYKVNKCVQTNLIQAILRENEVVFLLLSLTSNLTAPELELVQQVAKSVITELVLREHLHTEGVREEWNDDREITVVDVNGAVTPRHQVNERNPVVVRCHFSHEVGQCRLLKPFGLNVGNSERRNDLQKCGSKRNVDCSRRVATIKLRAVK